MTLPPITNMPAPTPPQRPNAPRPMFSALAISSSGLSAQRVRMEVIAQNLANVETTHTAEGGPYHRRVVTLEPVEPQGQISTVNTGVPGAATPAAPTAGAPGGAGANGAAPSAAAAAINATAAATQNALASATGMGAGTMGSDVDETGGVRVASITEDKRDGPMIYDPGNPDADKNGYVRMPNVNMTDELMDLMNARRIYEANATVFQVARAMLHKAIDI